MSHNRKSPKSAKTEYTREAILESLQAAMKRAGIDDASSAPEPPEGAFLTGQWAEMMKCDATTALTRLKKLVKAGQAEILRCRAPYGRVENFYKIKEQQ